jgi:hypothetical protein
LQDLGFLSFTLPEVAILMPTKKPRGAELTLEQHLANQVLHQRRLRIEHVNSSVKCCRIVKDRTGLWRILRMAQIEHKRISVYARSANRQRTPERISPCSSSLYSIHLTSCRFYVLCSCA